MVIPLSVLIYWTCEVFKSSVAVTLPIKVWIDYDWEVFVSSSAVTLLVKAVKSPTAAPSSSVILVSWALIAFECKVNWSWCVSILDSAVVTLPASARTLELVVFSPVVSPPIWPVWVVISFVFSVIEDCIRGMTSSTTTTLPFRELMDVLALETAV